MPEFIPTPIAVPIDAPARQGLSAAVRHLGIPMFVFGAVFLLSIVIITFLFSPQRYPVKVGDKMIRLRDMEEEQVNLSAKKQTLLAQQKSLQSQLATPVLNQVALRLKGRTALGRAMNAVLASRDAFALSNWNPVTIDQMQFDGSRLRISGFTEDAGGRSMQILASFVDSLRGSGAFGQVSEPEYRQVAGKNDVLRSPFTIFLPLVRDE